MKAAAIFLVLALAAVAVYARRNYDLSAHPRALFKQWAADYKITFASEKERKAKYAIFHRNLLKINELNARYNGQAIFGLNEFSHIDPKEFLLTHTGTRNANAYKSFFTSNMSKMLPLVSEEKLKATPPSVDWRQHNPPVVTGVKNQGQCGDCWAFSTTGNVEGQWALAGHTLTSLSEQNLCDCDTQSDCCDGGMMNNAFEYIIQNGGIDTEASYPYEGYQGNCRYKKSNIGAKISSYNMIAHDPVQMASVVASQGPISIAVDAESWQYYNGGIIKSNCGTSLDHGVLIVGYGTQGSTDYWIVKNSWGKSWGLSGFLMVERGPQDMCGIDKYPITSVV